MGNAVLDQLKAMASQQGFAKLSADVELPVDMTGTDVCLTHVEIAAEWQNGKPTENLKTKEVLNEETGEMEVHVQVRCTVQFVQGSAVAPAKLNSLWMMADDAMKLLGGVQTQAKVKLVNPRIIPFIETYKREGSTFTNERAAVRWRVDGIELA